MLSLIIQCCNVVPSKSTTASFGGATDTYAPGVTTAGAGRARECCGQPPSGACCACTVAAMPNAADAAVQTSVFSDDLMGSVDWEDFQEYIRGMQGFRGFGERP
ncbi:hypothetical protein MASR1M101_23420 [Gemmatimonas sp.]